MKFTLSWLKDHLETSASVAEIGKTLTMIGLEIEEIIDPAAALDGFLVGHVLTAEKHPDADRLRLCTVSTGSQTLQIVCGAPNARAGLKVALALPGCKVPATGDVLKKGKVRGIESQGMMCSTRELNLGESDHGILELPEETPVGVPLASVLALDPVFDIAVTPNRADCLGVRGVARDLAAAGLGSLKDDPLQAPVAGTFASPIKVVRDFADAEQGAACPLFIGRTLRGVRNGDSPQWLKDRLQAVGLRPISALVDITNYVTLGWARPLHVFDADKLSGDVVVRLGKADGETIDALNDKTYTVKDDVVVIADAAGAQSIGGIVGGTATGCTLETTTVFLEAALFDPRRIARGARSYGIDSDAKHRFERGVDPVSTQWGIELATRLILDLCGGESSELVVAGALPAAASAIAFDPARVEKLIGISVPVATMRTMLTSLGCQVAGEDSALSVVPPSWRSDISEAHDLIEEVARLNGYDNLPLVSLPRPAVSKPTLTPRQKANRFVSRTLAQRGLRETVTWSFLPSAQAKSFGGGQEELRLANPISSDLDAMRPSILPNLLSAAGRNAARGYADVALFEVGPQFQGGNPGDQTKVAAGLRTGLYTPRHWAEKKRPVDLYDVKADALAALKAAGVGTDNAQIVAEAPSYYHPGRSGAIKLGPTVLAYFGDIHPGLVKDFDVKGAAVAFEVFLDRLPLPKPRATRARPLLVTSAFQPLDRDFAMVVDLSVTAESMIKAVKGVDRKLITAVELFDVFQGGSLPEGKKSVALSVTLQPTDKTLTDPEIEALSAKIVAALEKATGGSLRA